MNSQGNQRNLLFHFVHLLLSHPSCYEFVSLVFALFVALLILINLYSNLYV